MLKRLLRSVSVILTLALVFSIVTCAPFSVGAAEADTAETSAVASSFGELNEGKYTLVSMTYQLTADFDAQGYIYVPTGVTAEIDLNGHTIDRGLSTASGGPANGRVIKNEGTLTITDSSGDDSGKITGGFNRHIDFVVLSHMIVPFRRAVFRF